MIIIKDGSNNIEEVKQLIKEYLIFLNRDLSFQNIEEELSDLQEKYTGNNGEILIALVDHQIAGCVAYYKHNELRCEMKRLFVRDEYRGLKIGNKLVEEIVKHACMRGYQEMVLDTIETLKAARHIYKKNGFVECDAYYDNPMEDVIYMKKDL